MKASQNAIQLIKNSEGLLLKAYQCQADVWTIGWGHTENVKAGDIITLAQAITYLSLDINHCERQLNLCLPNLNQNQFDALIDFIFNFGESAFLNSSLYKIIKSNINDKAAISEQFNRWIHYYKGGQWHISSALIARRQKEIDLFFKQ